jgi:hypothetical protein
VGGAEFMAKNFNQRCPEMMALLHHTEDSIFFKDMDGRFILVSEAKARKSAVDSEVMIGKTDFDFLPLKGARKCRDDEILIMETCESPIVSIASTIKLVARGRFGEVSESVKQTLTDVFNRLVKLEKIVGEYLTKSSVMSSTTIGRKQILDLREDIIDPILGEFAQEIERGEILIDNRLGGIPGNKILVSANKNWLGIVYRNLLDNAIRYTPRGGIIAYGFEDQGEMYRLNVFNSGPSISPGRRNAIFRFYSPQGVNHPIQDIFRAELFPHGTNRLSV